MEEELSMSDFRLLYHIYTHGGQYRGSKSKLGQELKSGSRIYDRITKLIERGYIEESRNELKLTKKGKEALIPFYYFRVVLLLYLPIVGITIVSEGILYIYAPSVFTPISLLTGGVTIIIGALILLWGERRAETKFIESFHRV